jgi:hypothetical protein
MSISGDRCIFRPSNKSSPQASEYLRTILIDLGEPSFYGWDSA